MKESILQIIAIRLEPGADIRRRLEQIAKESAIKAGVILGAVGSLSTTCLRFAGSDRPTALTGKREILTLSGMLSESGVHLHMSVSDKQGHCVGGHVVYGCEIYTTLELVIGLMSAIAFKRELDVATGFPELAIYAESAPPLN